VSFALKRIDISGREGVSSPHLADTANDAAKMAATALIELRSIVRFTT
jgi:hypothetical protein